MKKTLAAATLAVLLTGCASQSGSVDDDPQAGNNRPAEAEQVAEEAPVEEAPVEEAPAPASTNLKFGETFTYENGVSLTVGTPEPFTPSEYAAADEAPAYLKMTLTIVNGGTENLDPAGWYGTMQSGNVEASKVYDSEQLGDEPSTTILPGREATFAVGYGVMDPADLVFEVTAGMFEYDDVIFTS